MPKSLQETLKIEINSESNKNAFEETLTDIEKAWVNRDVAGMHRLFK